MSGRFVYFDAEFSCAFSLFHYLFQTELPYVGSLGVVLMVALFSSCLTL